MCLPLAAGVRFLCRCTVRRLAQQRLLGLVLEDQAFEHAARQIPVLFVELADGLELEQQALIGSALGLPEQQGRG